MDLEKDLRQTAADLERIEKELKRLEEEGERRIQAYNRDSAPPRTMSTPEDFNEGPHYPGLG